MGPLATGYLSFFIGISLSIFAVFIGFYLRKKAAEDDNKYESDILENEILLLENENKILDEVLDLKRTELYSHFYKGKQIVKPFVRSSV